MKRGRRQFNRRKHTPENLRGLFNHIEYHNWTATGEFSQLESEEKKIHHHKNPNFSTVLVVDDYVLFDYYLFPFFSNAIESGTPCSARCLGRFHMRAQQ